MKIFYGEPQGFAWLFGIVLAVLSPFIPDAYHYMERFPFFASNGSLFFLALAIGTLLVIGVLMDLTENSLYRFSGW